MRKECTQRKKLDSKFVARKNVVFFSTKIYSSLAEKQKSKRSGVISFICKDENCKNEEKKISFRNLLSLQFAFSLIFYQSRCECVTWTNGKSTQGFFCLFCNLSFVSMFCVCVFVLFLVSTFFLLSLKKKKKTLSQLVTSSHWISFWLAAIHRYYQQKI